ncbi:hypothetical protein HK104_006775 [Borealophlyctis nickersoniae]|nr:hypothetical protein HK104_006775 [Borealophlyctis nickersoniae]
MAACETYAKVQMKLEEEEADRGLAATETLFENNLDKQFDQFELYVLRNILAVPEDVPIRLPHREGLDRLVTAEEEKELDAELAALRGKLYAAKYFQARVKRETAQIQKRRPALEKIKMHTDRLLELSQQDNGTPLPTSFQTILTHLQTSHTLRSRIRAQTVDVSFSDLISRKRRHDDESDNMDSAIAAAIERRRKQVIVAATPRKRRNTGFKVEGGEWEVEWKERMDAGSGGDVQTWRQLFHGEQ